jgi:mycothiol synthase
MPPVEIRRFDRPAETEAEVLLTGQVRSSAGALHHLEARLDLGRWSLVEADPAATPPPDDLVSRLVLEAHAIAAAPVEWWVEPADGRTDAAADAADLHLDRDLLQMRRPLPLTDPAAIEAAAVPTRPFVPGVDERAWLEVNNAAFHWHEDQADWTLPQLEAKEAEDWFDPAGFLLHDEGSRLAAFCWTRVHLDTEPPMGEIFVIAVHPDWHGRGLGRALTAAGLAHLASRGLSVGMLYVESTNTAAIRTYERLGFTVHHRRRRYASP